MSSLLQPYFKLQALAFETTWSAPANIAFVKYWGKKGHQVPANPSLSMTLSECLTTTKTRFTPAEELSVVLTFEGKQDEKFARKIHDYLSSLKTELPWIENLRVDIETSNTFPHGAGIASSASGLAAFALTLADYLEFLCPEGDNANFFKRASYLARLASGSACRSVYGGFTTWGENSLSDSSDIFATRFEVHPELLHLHDSVLVIDSQEKAVSSRAGHGRMQEHFFAEARFKQARHHFELCMQAMRIGDLEVIGKVLEAEALSLHAMMLTSPEPYTLFRSKSLSAIEAIWDFRRETQLPLYFTLDAGPNLHLIYPDSHKNKIQTFIAHELSGLCEKIIDDHVGEGPIKC